MKSIGFGKFSWIGVALLSASWLLGLSYYHQANYVFWSILLVAGTFFLMGNIRWVIGRGKAATAMIMIIPGLWFSPWPYRIAFLFLIIGLALQIFPIPRRWPKYLSCSALVSGIVLLGQSLTILVYKHLTAFSHELPSPLTHLLGVVARLLGFEVAVNNHNLCLFSMRKVHPLGATWELFLDPVTLCYLVGGIIFLTLQMWTDILKKRRRKELLLAISKLIAGIILWLPIRSALLMAIYIHQAVRTDYDSPLKLMNQFCSPWVHLLLLIVPVLLSWRFIQLSYPEECKPVSAPLPSMWRTLISIALTSMAVAVITAGIVWEPGGERKAGQVYVDEYHSDWESTERTFDTNWYGEESGYNYACIYDYCSRFYQMSRINTPLDKTILRNCDVLIIKVPTKRYEPEEIEIIRKFVNNGGGLMLIGEHTNVFKTGTHLNDIAKTFGFTFRYDCLFDIDSVFTQYYQPPLVPHPIIQHIPPMDFAVSCSIAPGKSSGQAVMCSTGLWNLPADYYASNFYPQVEERAEARYGAFIQLWAMRYGTGRVVAFTDSTIFSNFSTFEPGKSELMPGMIEWLNHRNMGMNPSLWLTLIGVALLVTGLSLAWAWKVSYLLILGAGIVFWTLTGYGVRSIHQISYPLPQSVRPMVQVMIDRTICDTPLSKSGFIGAKEDGFGIFEQWILRQGYFISRRNDNSVFNGNLLVLFYPSRDVSNEFRQGLVRYVTAGGKVLILDSPENTKSTTNNLLYPFGLAVEQESYESNTPETDSFETPQTILEIPRGWPQGIEVSSYCRIKGGQPFIRVNGEPVAASARYGKGLITVIGFGSLFTDVNMGTTGDVIPDENLRKVFELEFSILREMVNIQ